MEEQLIENLLRENLTPIEEAESYQHLMQVNNWNGKQLASALNVSPTRISRALALLKLPHEMRTRIDSGELSARAGYELSRLPEPTLARVADQVDPASLTAAKARSTVRQRKGNAVTRGCKQTFVADNGWKVIVTSPRKGSYHEIEQALFIALEEVRTRIDNRVQLLRATTVFDELVRQHPPVRTGSGCAGRSAALDGLIPQAAWERPAAG